MKQQGDIIQFENRREIENVIAALNTYCDEHPSRQKEVEAARNLSDLLETMHISW